jgi:hypothetical protein
MDSHPVQRFMLSACAFVVLESDPYANFGWQSLDKKREDM